MRKKFMSDEMIRVDPNVLVFAPWNPQRRIDATDKAFKTLVKSLRDYGQFLPALINEHGLVIDGNRRVAACQLLDVPVQCVVRGNSDPWTVYEIVNRVRLSVTGDQTAEIYMKEKRALSRQKQSTVERLAAAFGGVEKLKEYLDSKHTWEKFGTANQVRLFCKWIMGDDATPADTWVLIQWMRDHDIRGANLGHSGLRGWCYDLREFEDEMRKPFRGWLWSEIIKKNQPLPIRLSFNTNWGGTTMDGLVVFWAAKYATKKVREKAIPYVFKRFYQEVEKWGSCDAKHVIEALRKKGVVWEANKP